MWELQAIKDLLCVRDIAGISSVVTVVTVAYQISIETNCVGVSFLVKLHEWGSATFLRKQLTDLDIVLNTPLWATNLVLTIAIQMSVKIQMIIEAVVQRCSVKKRFLEISQNSQENTCTRISFIMKLQAWACHVIKKGLWHKCFSVNFANFLRTPFVSEQLRWLLLFTSFCK